MMISQEYFDEMCLENAELFDDLSPEQAVQDTLEQLQMTTTTSSNNGNNSSSSSSSTTAKTDTNTLHLLTTFPTSPDGMQQRAHVAEFQQAMRALQAVAVEHENDNALDQMDAIQKNLKLVDQRLFGRLLHVPDGGDKDDKDNANNIVQSTTYMALFVSPMLDGLKLYLQLWYCLNNKSSSSSSSSSSQDDDDHHDVLYRMIWSTLVRVLQENEENNKRRYGRDYYRQTLTMYQKSFSSSMMISLWLQTVDVKLQQLQENKDRSETILAVTQDLNDLFTLAYFSVKQCEANKKALMGVNTTSSSSSSSSATTTTTTTSNRINLVQVVLQSLDFLLVQLQQHQLPHKTSNNAEQQHLRSTLLGWTRDIGRLITALDTFDDFSSNNVADNNSSSSSSSSGGVVSSGHDNVQAWKQARAVDKLHALLVVILQQQQQQQQYDKDDNAAAMATEAAAAAIVLALRSMAIQDDIVQSMVAIGILDTATQILLDFDSLSSNSSSSSSSLELLAAVMGLVRNLCANDEIKTNLCLGSSSSSSGGGGGGDIAGTKSSIAPGIVQAMQQNRKTTSDNQTTSAMKATLQEHAIGTLAAMALRKPYNADYIVRTCHAHEAILQAMKDYPLKTTLQRQGALALRNIASRAGTLTTQKSSVKSTSLNGGDHEEENQDLRSILLQAGAANVLRETAAKHLHCQDEVYAALRDLGVPNNHFTMVHVDQGATATHESTASGIATFGQGHNRNFRAVQEESK